MRRVGSGLAGRLAADRASRALSWVRIPAGTRFRRWNGCCSRGGSPMSAVSSRLLLAIAVTVLAPACALDKEDPEKGLVDDSTPPSGAPGATGIGKADGSG